jgi:hypothetical protein
MRTSLVRTLIVAGAVTALAAAAGPVAAEITTLSTLPDGPGTATITWSGHGGDFPTIGKANGTVEHYAVHATGKVPRSDDHGATPPTETLATIKGTLDGTAFSLAIHLDIFPPSLATGGNVGTVNGTYDGRPVSLTLAVPANARAAGKFVGFDGAIGSQSVVGTISIPVHKHGKSSARSSFMVSN